jgi:hypothetical protein
MGIARRKSGTVVRCPRCAGELIVPTSPQPAAATGGMPLNQLFEAEEFGKELSDAPSPAAEELPNPLMPPPPYGHRTLTEAHSDSRHESTPSASAPDLRRPGLFVPTPLLVLLAVLVAGLVGLTFLFGFLLGRWSALG